jgi:hypothetical protein
MRSVPGVLDDRASSPSRGRLLLPDERPRPEWHEDRSLYGSFFLDHNAKRTRLHGTDADVCQGHLAHRYSGSYEQGNPVSLWSLTLGRTTTVSTESFARAHADLTG